MAHADQFTDFSITVTAIATEASRPPVMRQRRQLPRLHRLCLRGLELGEDGGFNGVIEPAGIDGRPVDVIRARLVAHLHRADAASLGDARDDL